MKRIRRIICSSFLCAALVGSTCIVSAEKGFEESMAVKEIISFVGYEADAGQPYQIIRLKEKIAEAEIAFPQTLTVNLAGKTEPETLAVSWQTAEDYANSTYDTYIFTPVWDTSEYELAFENDMSPFIEVQITQGIEENLTNTINNTYSNVITLGTGGTYANFSALFDEPSIQGDVVVSLKSDINETQTDTPLIIPERFTSLTIQSDSSGTQRAFNINEKNEFSSEEMNSLYAKGCSLIISKDIVFGSPVNEWKYNNASIYGGGYKENVTGNTNIEFNGVLKQGNIFGGGFNSNVDGNTKVIIGGEVYGIVAGGGYAEAGENDLSALTLNANVSGSATIDITNASQYVKYVRGGGVAYQANAQNVMGKHVLNANVDKGVTITINGVISNEDFAIIGGGYAECEPLYEFQAELKANVSGVIKLNFEDNAQGYSYDDWDFYNYGVYGGGYAESVADQSSKSRSVNAQAMVTGSIEIIAVKDSINLDYQDDHQTFRCLYGGGYASGLGSDATVTGNTKITTARPVWESDSGVFGGGYAVKSGTADVIGTTHITIQKINGQYDYENANGVFGGGHAVGNYDPVISNETFKPSQANVGSTEITIKKGATMVYGNTKPGVSIAGGGLVDGSEQRFNNEYPATAKVLGDVKITIEDNVALASGFIGGGAVIIQGNASVSGAVNIILGNNCKIVTSENRNYIGGGYVYNSNNGNSNAIANVEGNLIASFGNNVMFMKSFFAGGYVEIDSASGQADVNGNITYIFGGSASVRQNYTGNGTIKLEAGKSLSIGGTAAGTTQLEIQGSPAKDQVYVTVANGGSAEFIYTGSNFNLEKEVSGNTHTWKLVEAEIPVNSISGITEGKEYFKGDTLAFTALGNGMENNTPSLNNKRWLPSKCLIDTTEINLDSAYSGTIITANLSTGEHKLSITFTEQRYDGSDWSNTGRDDIKEVTFILKEKSSTPSSGGGSYAPSTKKEGFVENSGKTYYYINGKPADNGFILLDKDQQLVQALSPDQFIQKPTTADAVYYIKEDRTIAKNEWVVLDQNGNFVDTMPLNEFKDAYGEEYKLYAAREDGQLVQSWLEVNGVWFYFLEDYSARYQYWQAHWNDWYLFEHYTYVTNRWQPTSEGRWYYLDSEGRMVRNQWIDGCWIDGYGIYWSPIYTPEND